MNVNRCTYKILMMFILTTHDLCFSASADEQAPQLAQAAQEFDSFGSFRTDLLARIGGASKRIWISTNFLTDAEIVSSLYIAQYRKVQISVLLGKEKANNILSRLGYLKQVNIPVAIKPKNFFGNTPTLVLLDDKLISVNSDLDYLSKHSKFVVKELESNELASFESSFQDAAKNQDTPEVRPLPLVGTQRPRKTHQPTPKTSNEKFSGTEAAGENAEQALKAADNETQQAAIAGGETGTDGVYRYRRIKERPAAGIPTKLPKMTLGQELEKKRATSANPPGPEAAGTP